jgi:hypothetical protein
MKYVAKKQPIRLAQWLQLQETTEDLILHKRICFA